MKKSTVQPFSVSKSRDEFELLGGALLGRGMLE